MEYTRKEKEAIDKAYSLLEYLAGFDMIGPDRLDAALKYERNGRSGLTIAKRLLVENAAKGIEGFREGQELTSSDLWGMSQGCAVARMLGGDLARRAERYSELEDYGREFLRSVSRFVDLAVLSNAAGDQALTRYLNRTNDLLREKLAGGVA
jgi:hypothetical protein